MVTVALEERSTVTHLVRNLGGLLCSRCKQFDKRPDPDQLSYFLRVFGNDVAAVDIFQFDLEALKNKFNFLNWFTDLASDHNIDVTKNYHFLHATIVIPTGTGLSLLLLVQLLVKKKFTTRN